MPRCMPAWPNLRHQHMHLRAVELPVRSEGVRGSLHRRGQRREQLRRMRQRLPVRDALHRRDLQMPGNHEILRHEVDVHRRERSLLSAKQFGAGRGPAPILMAAGYRTNRSDGTMARCRVIFGAERAVLRAGARSQASTRSAEQNGKQQATPIQLPIASERLFLLARDFNPGLPAFPRPARLPRQTPTGRFSVSGFRLPQPSTLHPQPKLTSRD
jgi:hypothetical protein